MCIIRLTVTPAAVNLQQQETEEENEFRVCDFIVSSLFELEA